MHAPLATAIIVAHGSPSDPHDLDAYLMGLARCVERNAAGFLVEGATLGLPGSLESALARARAARLPAYVYPHFMADGWFVNVELRRRVAAAGDAPVTYLPPFGLDPALPDLVIRRLDEHLTGRGHDPAQAVIVLAAHGSKGSRASAEATRAMAAHVHASGRFGDVRFGFVEEAPSIAEAASKLEGRAGVCLPLFAVSAGHVTGDIPQQLAEAAFPGDILPPIGEDRDVPHLIARALMARLAVTD